MIRELLLFFLFMSIAAFFAMKRVKEAAKIAGAQRIPERMLLLLSFFGGAAGALIAMKRYRHKTLHNRFRYGIPVMLALHVLLLGWLILRNVLPRFSI